MINANIGHLEATHATYITHATNKQIQQSNKLSKVPENLTIYRLKSSLQMYIAMHYNVMYYNVMYIAMHWICIASVAQTNATTHFGTHEHPQTCNRYFVCARWLREKINVLHDASYYYSTDALYSCGGFIIADSWSIGGRLVWVTSSGYIAPRQKDIYIANTYICTSYTNDTYSNIFIWQSVAKSHELAN